MKQYLIAFTVSLLAANPVFADAKNECKLDVITTPSPIGLGPIRNRDAIEILMPMAQEIIDEFDDIYSHSGGYGIAQALRMFVTNGTMSAETAIHIGINYISCELQ